MTSDEQGPPASGKQKAPVAYSVDAASQVTSLGRTRLFQLVASGELPSVRVGGRRIILHDDLMAFLHARRVTS